MAMEKLMAWRSIGPFRGGRVVAVTAHPSNAHTFYFGAVAGGVWKTTDAGISWYNISDHSLNAWSIGALDISSTDPNILYVGTGEACLRGNVTHGQGVFRTSDGGRHWESLGLSDSRHIARIRIHPTQPDWVYVAAIGHAFGPNTERGVFRTRDGGRNWERVLYLNPETGATDLVLDPFNPRRLWAAMYQVKREPWSFTSGGPGSGLWRSEDGGNSWTNLTKAPGLPQGPLGRIGISASGAQEDLLYMSVEAAEGGIFVSHDGGDHWEVATHDPEVRQRPWYFSHIFADPQSPGTVYVLNFEFLRSLDFGRHFESVPTPHVDHHDLWIDPHNPQRMINGHDGGAAVSLDGGKSWSTILNQPTAQFYHLAVDHQVPPRVYGTQQDNSSISVPLRSFKAAITVAEQTEVGGGESGYIVVHPAHNHIIFAGNYGLLTRYDQHEGTTRVITPWPEDQAGHGASHLRYRFNWTFPIAIDPHPPYALYAGAQVVFRSVDEGQSWETISPDLTRADTSKMVPSGGPITKDNTSVEYFGTLSVIAVSPLAGTEIWTGSDDGRVHCSQDGGKTWHDVTPPEIPAWAFISGIEPSHHVPGRVYVAANRYKLDDLTPYIWRSDDYGHSWTPCHSDLPSDAVMRIVREDPLNPHLLFAGTECGVFYSRDGGNHWLALNHQLPLVPVHDLAIAGNSLVAATHGRSFWVLDDITPLRVFPTQDPDHLQVAVAPTHFIWPEPARLPTEDKSEGFVSTGPYTTRWKLQEKRPIFPDAGRNPEDGIYVYYQLPVNVEHLRITVKDSRGNPITTTDETQSLPTVKGTHGWSWSCRYPDPENLEGAVFRGGRMKGPLAPPGLYSVTLTTPTEEVSTTFELVPLPHTRASDLEKRWQLLMNIGNTLTAVHRLFKDMTTVKETLISWQQKGFIEGSESQALYQELLDQIDHLRNQLNQYKALSAKDLLNYPIQLNGKLTSLARWVQATYGAPTTAMLQVYNDLKTRFQEVQSAWTTTMKNVQELSQQLDITKHIVFDFHKPADE
ncbi:WD40/YVTN/BNR-like repeat-containing protein [Sulfobacillus thermosulfidooxidans]|uniref:WD40/YVTN/BNR-like repeat-containing protein n=1 Tax=Sulfobacillus thermosulfidooxidans TaxID=28034 RepID=UPI00111C073C|nr:glycosyl hydrolase [Sulfobacillus thermosulfidooxidans]